MGQDHSEVVKSLCQNCLQRMDAAEALNYLVKRLLVVARSPHRAPTDLLHSVTRRKLEDLCQVGDEIIDDSQQRGPALKPTSNVK